jgi:hypothetical protein
VNNQPQTPQEQQALQTATTLGDGVDQFVQSLKQWQISDDAQYEHAGKLLLEVHSKRKSIEETRLSFVKPLNDTVSRINAFFRGPRDQYDAAKAALKGAMGRYQAQKEQAKQAAIAAAAQAAAQQVQQAPNLGPAAAPLQATNTFNVMMQHAAQHQSPEAAGVASQEVWRFQIDDPSQLPREYLMPNEAAIRAVVNTQKGLAQIPGVRVWRELTVRPTGR